MALLQSITTPPHVVVVAVVSVVVIVVAICAFSSSSRAEMVTDFESPDVLHTLVVCGCRVQRRLVPISMREGLDGLRWGWESDSWPWWW